MKNIVVFIMLILKLMLVVIFIFHTLFVFKIRMIQFVKHFQVLIVEKIC